MEAGQRSPDSHTVGEQPSSAVAWTTWHHQLHQRLLRQPELLPDGTRLLLAISGGQDSMALLGLLQGLQPKHRWSLRLWHGDHGWQPTSANVASELQHWCAGRGLELCVTRAPEQLARTEAAARQWRYDALECQARSSGADVVSGHTASDRAETLLLQMARGSDMAGLSGLKPVRSLSPEGPRLRRPLLGFSRADTAQICSDLALPVWEDPSNHSAAFARNRIRAEVLPVLEELHPGCSRRMAEQAGRLSQLRDIQSELGALALNQLQDSEGLKRRRLGELGHATRRQLLAQWLQHQGVPAIDAAVLDQLSGRLKAGAAGGSSHLPGGWQLHWQGASLRLQPPGAER